MLVINRVFCEVLTRKSLICTLCFEAIPDDEKAYNIKDEIVSDGNCTDLLEMIRLLMNHELPDIIAISDLVCYQCTNAVISSYKFVQICKQKFKLFVGAAETFHSLNMEYNNSKIFFIKFNGSGADDRNYYNHETAEEMSINIEKNVITNNPHIDTEDSSSDVHSSTNKKVYDRINISTNEMMLDKNDHNNFKCKVCMKEFLRSSNLRQHFIRLHAPKKHKCTECTKMFGSKGILQQHKEESHTNAVCSECGKYFKNKAALKIHESGHNTILPCKQCGKVYKRYKSLKAHIGLGNCGKIRTRFTSNPEFICNYCGKAYHTKNSLRVHIRFEHLNEEPYYCNCCHKKYYSLSALKCHKVKHTKEKNFICAYCGGRFVTRESLLYHTRIHTGEKPYPCDYCEEKFISASRRMAHVRRKHMDPSIECDICKTKFRMGSSLKQHRKRHFDLSSKLFNPDLVKDT